MKFLHIYNFIKNKTWKLIEEKYFSETSKSYKILNRLRLLYYSNIQLKKTKLLIVFSIVIGLITAIDESIAVYTIIKISGALFDPENIETTIKIIFTNIIPIIGFMGSLYLILRRSAGLWLIGIWSSLLIIPIFLSYNENGLMLCQYFPNFFNASPLLSAVFASSNSLTQTMGTDFLYNLDYVVKYSPYTSGIGVNVVPIFYLLTIFVILRQNKKIFSLKNWIAFALIIVFSISAPFAVYSFSNILHDEKIADFEKNRLAFLSLLKNYPNAQSNLQEKCFEFSRPWFKANENQTIIEVSCYNNGKKITFTK